MRLAAVALLLAAAAAMPARAETVFVHLTAALDEPRGLCLDIPGHRDRVNTARAMSVHSCKRGIWNLDERFDPAAFETGVLRMPEYDLCVGAAQAADGSSVLLGPCDGDALRRWDRTGGRLRLAADPSLCITVDAAPSELTSGGRRLPSRHVARPIAMAPCSDAAADRQVWQTSPPE